MWRWLVLSASLHVVIFFGISLRFESAPNESQPQSVELVFELPSQMSKSESPRRNSEKLKSAKTGSRPTSKSSDFVIQELKKSQLKSVGESELQLSGPHIAMDEESRYLLQVREQIKLQQFYPGPSRQFREQGQVRIRMTLDRMGSVLKIETLQASPFRRLNDAAIKAIIRAAPFGPFPGSLGYEHWNITVPFSFELTAGS